MTRRIRTTGISPSRRRCISKSHCYFWRWHQLAVAFVALAGLGVAIAASIFTVPSAKIAIASGAENVKGWAWADPIGWISLNDTNTGSGGGTYGVNVNLTTGEMNGFGWSENAGWVCFGNSCGVAPCTGVVPASFAPYNAMYAKVDQPPYSAGPTIRRTRGWAKVCNEGDQGWISLNCGDLNPSACGSYGYWVPFNMSTLTFTNPTAPGSPLNGTSFAWNGNSDLSGFGYIDFSRAYLNPPPENTMTACIDHVDNDLDGAIDCADSDCRLLSICTPPPPIKETDCTAGSIDLCCSNGIDDDFDGAIDCADSDCQGVASMCTVAWLKTEFGSVYAQQGIAAIAAPAAQFNASYCLSLTEGSITGFASQLGCTATTSALSLPSAAGGYRGSLGNIDLAGIRNGRYGEVVPIADGNALPESLNGKVYRYSSGGVLTLPSKMFQNGTGPTGRGNGLLFVDGSDLRISSNMSYRASTVDNYLRNLASFGIIVTTDPTTGMGGNVMIDPGVSQLVGAYFAERSISTGVSTVPLNVYGLFASRLINFQRTGGTSSTAAENVSFDGRAVANPPPGMQDVGKSLPTVKEAF